MFMKKLSKKSKKGDSAAKEAEPEEQDSDLDLENDLKPIRDYVKDRDEMLQQMFKCVLKADKLQAMLPDILKVSLTLMPAVLQRILMDMQVLLTSVSKAGTAIFCWSTPGHSNDDEDVCPCSFLTKIAQG